MRAESIKHKQYLPQTKEENDESKAKRFFSFDSKCQFHNDCFYTIQWSWVYFFSAVFFTLISDRRCKGSRLASLSKPLGCFNDIFAHKRPRRHKARPADSRPSDFVVIS